MNNLEIACIIPGRGGSKGIPLKNLRPIANKPLIQWSIEHAMASKFLNGRVYVSSDSPQILAVAESCGAKSILRPAELAADHSSSEDALLHALEFIQSETLRELDYVVFLQPTSPIRKKDDIDRALSLMLEEQSDSLFSALPVHDLFLWSKEGGTAESVNFDYKNRKRRQDIPVRYWENGSIYIFKPSILLKNRNRLGGKISIFPMEKSCSFQIDDMDDIEICESILIRGLR